MLDIVASWVEVPDGPNDHQYRRYPNESLADWHERFGLTDEAGD